MIKVIWAAGMVLLAAGVPAGEARETRQTRMDACALEREAVLAGLTLDARIGRIELQSHAVIEDDGPGSGKPQLSEGTSPWTGQAWIEDLLPGVRIKKTLVLDDPRAWSGEVMFLGFEAKGNQVPLQMAVNGVRFTRPASMFALPHAVQYGMADKLVRWYFVPAPVGALRAGENAIELWVDEAAAGPEGSIVPWRIVLSLDENYSMGSTERTRHPNRSMKSEDGGQTWRDARLGARNAADGEYAVRLGLERHLNAGRYLSPVIDCVEADSVLDRRAEELTVSLLPEVAECEGGRAELSVRSGAGPAPEEGWTGWQPLAKAGGTLPAGHRYMQMRADLATTNPLASPALTALSLEATWTEPKADGTNATRLQSAHNGRIVAPSYPFAYENIDHPGLKELRDRNRLDEVVAGAHSEFDQMLRLLHWAYRVPVNDRPFTWDWNEIINTTIGPDGKPVLQGDYTGRRRDAMCLFSNQALIGALLAYGHQARHININSEAMSGHEVTEVWSNEFNKWIYLDATRDYYYFDPETGTPLNLLEIHDRLAGVMPRAERLERPFVPEIGTAVAAAVPVGIREGENAFPVRPQALHLMETMGYFRIIPRNDFLSQPRPFPVGQGYMMWGWDGYINHYDDMFPARREHQTQSNRASDFYEPLNQAEIHLAETATPGALAVLVVTKTPNLEKVEFRTGAETEWAELKPDWQWELTQGLNRLEARTLNTRGVTGPVSVVQVMYNR